MESDLTLSSCCPGLHLSSQAVEGSPPRDLHLAKALGLDRVSRIPECSQKSAKANKAWCAAWLRPISSYSQQRSKEGCGQPRIQPPQPRAAWLQIHGFGVPAGDLHWSATKLPSVKADWDLSLTYTPLTHAHGSRGFSVPWKPNGQQASSRHATPSPLPLHRPLDTSNQASPQTIRRVA